MNTFRNRHVNILNGSDRILKGLQFVFRDVDFQCIDKYKPDGDSVCIDCDIAEMSGTDAVSLKYYANKANALFHIHDRKIVIWGGGNRGRQCVKLWSRMYPELEIGFIVDRLPEQAKILADGISVRASSNIKRNTGECFVVVCVDDGREICAELEALGYGVGKDYLSWKTAFEDLGTMLYETLMAERRHAFICTRPFGFTDIIGMDVFLCCPASHRGYSVGDMETDSFESIWHSIKANILRLSILNGSYLFCDEQFCDMFDLTRVSSEKTATENQYMIEDPYPRDVLAGFDGSCNLSCLSCRERQYSEEDDILKKRWETVREFLDIYAGKVDRLWLAGNGEVFFSKLYRKILNYPAYRARERISILSNGILFNEKTWKEFIEPYAHVDVVISVDGATKPTYEKLRRGGRFEVIKNNLEFLGNLRVNGEIDNLQINFVIQAENVSQLEEMRTWAKQEHVDSIKIIKFYDYGLDAGAGNLKSIVDESNHSIKAEYEQYFTSDILQDPIFDWAYMSSYLGMKSKKSLFIDGYSLW